MQFGPIWRALMRNKTGAVLIALQMAVTMAIMVNAISIIQTRAESMSRPSGVNEVDTFYLSSIGFNDNFNEQVAVMEDLAALRAMPGVVNAVQTNSVPLSGGGWSMSLATEAGSDVDTTGTAIYFVDEHGIETYDLKLVAGENFAATDMTWRTPEDSTWPGTALITIELAKALFGDDNWQEAVGQTIYIEETQPMTVKGIVERMQAAWNGWDGVERTTLVPQNTAYGGSRYIIRAEPGQRDTLMPQVEEMLAASNRDRLIRGLNTMEETRERSYQGDSSMIKLLLFTIGLLLLVTALGIVGLASFSVSRRTKQIGTRRALGASKADIARYFLSENLLISGVGVVLGAGLTIGLNIWMVDAFDLDSMNALLIPMAMAVLLVVGQLAVLGPARRAASVPPAVATRTI
ncbi:MAG: FtsX-like permease family protein [Pseudomonadota bacterium]